MLSTAASDDGAPEGFPFQLLPTHGTSWTPSQAKVTLSARMDARLVPSPASPGGVAAQLFVPVSLCMRRDATGLRRRSSPLSAPVLSSVVSLCSGESTRKGGLYDDLRTDMHGAGVRLAYSHVAVLDSFFGEPEREALLSQLTQPGWDHLQVSPTHRHPHVCSG